jgi:hypothetical protein
MSEQEHILLDPCILIKPKIYEIIIHTLLFYFNFQHFQIEKIIKKIKNKRN